MHVATLLVATALALGLWMSPSRADTTPGAPVDDLLLAATFVTEGTLPATEIEGGFSFTKSEADRTY